MVAYYSKLATWFGLMKMIYMRIQQYLCFFFLDESSFVTTIFVFSADKIGKDDIGAEESGTTFELKDSIYIMAQKH